MRLPTTVLLLTAMLGAASRPQQAEPVWALTLSDPEPVAIGAWSPTGTCIALATDTTVHVIDRSGRPLWSWRFHETNPYLHPRHNFSSVLAVSPTCDVVALSGGSDYRYLWTADRNGKHVFLKMVGTPFYGAFSLQGDSLAVTTSASFAYVLSPHLDVRWSGSLRELPVKWPGQATDTAARPVAELYRRDVEDLFGVRWGYGNGDSVSDDGQWRAATSAPWRGSTGTGVVELWGPDARGYNDRFSGSDGRHPRWTKRMACPSATITRDGMFVIANGDPSHAEYTDGDVLCIGEELPSYVFDRDGNTVVTWPVGGTEEGMSQAVLARTGRPLTLPAASSPTSVHIFVDLPPDPDRRDEIRTSRLASPDGAVILTIQDHELRLVRITK